MDFMECLECAVKPGSPILCPICAHNRAAMDHLRAENAALRKAVQSAEAWIVDGGHLDASNPYKVESAAMVVTELRAALAWQTEGEG